METENKENEKTNDEEQPKNMYTDNNTQPTQRADTSQTRKKLNKLRYYQVARIKKKPAFNLGDCVALTSVKLPKYNGLMDRNLISFFGGKNRKTHLMKMKMITKYGEIIEDHNPNNAIIWKRNEDFGTEHAYKSKKLNTKSSHENNPSRKYPRTIEGESKQKLPSLKIKNDYNKSYANSPTVRGNSSRASANRTGTNEKQNKFPVRNAQSVKKLQPISKGELNRILEKYKIMATTQDSTVFKITNKKK